MVRRTFKLHILALCFFLAAIIMYVVGGYYSIMALLILSLAAEITAWVLFIAGEHRNIYR